MKLWETYILSFGNLYLIDDIDIFEVNIDWLNVRLNTNNREEMKLLYLCILEVMKKYDKSRPNKTNMIFEKLEHFFYNYRFIGWVLNIGDIKDKVELENAEDFIVHMVNHFLNYITLGVFKYHKWYDLLPKKARDIVDRYYNCNKNNTASINLPFNYFGYEFNKKLDKKLNEILVIYLKYKHPKEVILKVRIKWHVDGENFYFKLVDLNNHRINDEPLHYLYKKIDLCRKNMYSRFLVVSLSLKVNGSKLAFREQPFINIVDGGDEQSITGKHRNILIYDKKTNILERFEPWGSLTSEKYNIHLVDKVLSSFFKKMNIYYQCPKNHGPVLGPQKIQSDNPAEKKCAKTGEPGRCIAWSIWYADTKMSNPDEGQLELLNKVMFLLKNKQNKMYTNYIRNYMLRVDVLNNILSIPDKILMENLLEMSIYKHNLPLDDFINIYSVLLFFLIPCAYINSHTKDKSLRLYLDGISLNIVDLTSYFNEPNNKLYFKSINQMEFKYGKKVIDIVGLVSILKSGYVINYLDIEDLKYNISNDVKLKSRNIIKYMEKINNALTKYNLDLFAYKKY